MIRKETYPVEDVLRFVREEKPYPVIFFDGDLMSMGSQRYRVFKRSTICVVCGIEGKYFAKERHLPFQGRFHFNLYATDAEGREVLMTKDHIIPRSLGGKDTMENYQTMCCICNRNKGNKIDEQE